MNYSGILQETLNTIRIERVNQFDKSFDQVDELLALYGEVRLANTLYDVIPQSVEWELVASLFSILIWSTSDNGSALTDETDQWLREGSDLRKIRIALHLDTCPFKSKEERINVLQELSRKFGEVDGRCKYLLVECNAERE